jgi:hypothetical protein
MSHKTLFTVIEGSERTYIHPFSYYDGGDKGGKNTLQFLSTPEFAPDQVATETDFLYELQKGAYKNPTIYRLRRFWDFTVRRFFCAFSKWSKYGSLRLLHNLPIYWSSVTPVYCAEIYDGWNISVPGTIVVSHPGMKLTDSCYLIPSQDWLSNKIFAWLYAQVDKSWEPEWQHQHVAERNAYLRWINKQVSLGRKIAFLSSLDT